MILENIFSAIGAVVYHSNQIENMLKGELEFPWLPRKLPKAFEVPETESYKFRSLRKEWARVMRAKIGNDGIWISKLSQIERCIIQTREWRDLSCHAPTNFVPDSFSLENLHFREICFRHKTDNPSLVRIELIKWIKLRKRQNQPCFPDDYVQFREFILRRGYVERNIQVSDLHEMGNAEMPKLVANIQTLHGFTSGFLTSEMALDMLKD